MTSFLKKYILLLWKDWLVQKRHWKGILCQLSCPVVAVLLLTFLRNAIPPTYITEKTKYNPLPLNSMSILEYINMHIYDVVILTLIILNYLQLVPCIPWI